MSRETTNPLRGGNNTTRVFNSVSMDIECYVDFIRLVHKLGQRGWVRDIAGRHDAHRKAATST